MTTNYWNGLEYQRHHLTRQFAAHGMPVHFIERTPQRWPRPGLADLRAWLRGAGYGSETMQKPVPKDVTIITPRWLPPAAILRPANRSLIRRTVKQLPKDSAPILITYVPSFNTIDLIDLLNPCITVYVSLFAYEDDIVMNDLLKAERRLAGSCDLLYSTCGFLDSRLRRITGRQDIHRSAHGVDYTAFARAYRGDELERREAICYFGGIGPHVDLDLYGRLAASGKKVVFIGVVDPAVRGRIPPEIELRPPLPSSDLPAALREMDVLIIAYRPSPYMRGVVSAKVFECLATGKPLLTAGWPEAQNYSDCAYDVGGSPEAAIDTIAHLPALHTPERQRRQMEIAQEADWSSRFTQLYRPIQEKLGDPLAVPEGSGHGN